MTVVAIPVVTVPVGTGPVVTVRYFAAARAALGTAEEDVELGPDRSIRALLDRIEARLAPAEGAAASAVLARCSFIVNGVATRDAARPLADGDRLDVLPPFAGG